MTIKECFCMEKNELLRQLGVRSQSKLMVNQEEAQRLSAEGKTIYESFSSAEDGEYYYYQDSPQEDEALLKLMAVRQTRDMRIMKNCMVFFAVLTAVSLILSLISVIVLMG